MGRQKPNSQVLHLAAESTAMRRKSFQYAMYEICSSVGMILSAYKSQGSNRETIQQNKGENAMENKTMRPLKHQLGLTRETLQNLAIER
jgi:hypothetical protein